ncbi:hypothetical protein C1645_823077 [Glomus cerebriforme]|uniref:Uncharacterized protein n=1 Tax=Glomus cerebriforme TaxID=658196 RepID=A0A397T692_9GLOM|nr:hypothetical protein C1645_823077 [Glomus cerebriforme]
MRQGKPVKSPNWLVGYRSIDEEFDINSTNGSLNVLSTYATSSKKRNIEDSNIETHNTNGKRIKTI